MYTEKNGFNTMLRSSNDFPISTTRTAKKKTQHVGNKETETQTYRSNELPDHYTETQTYTSYPIII